MAILVMFSNYFHDLATAIFAVSAVTAYLLQRSLAMRDAPAVVQPVIGGIQRVGYYALAWTLVFGSVRGITYREFEWVEAAGRNQVPALVVKHVFLVALVITGLVFLLRLRRLRGAAEGAEVGR